MQLATSVIEFGQVGAGDPPEAWLSTAEWDHWSGLPRNQFAEAWLGGRWCAKQVIRQLPGCGELRPNEIHIQSRNGMLQSVAPRVYVGGRLQGWRVSISHGRQVCGAAASLAEDASLGIDIVDLSAQVDRLSEHWFAPEERGWCEQGVSAAVIWGLKEAVFKAIGDGARFRPRQICVSRWLEFAHAEWLANEEQSPRGGLGLRNDGCLWWQRHGSELVIAVGIGEKIPRAVKQPEISTLAKVTEQ